MYKETAIIPEYSERNIKMLLACTGKLQHK